MIVLSTLLLLALGGLAARHLLFSFSAQSPAFYADTSPDFDIRRHLAGPMVSEGVIFGPLGRMAERFTARMEGTWDGADGRLSEVFSYSGGGVQNREWTLRVDSQGQITGTAPDVVGQARGRQSGATVRLRYRLRLPQGAGGHVLSVVDWLYLTADGTILNKSEMRMFGFKVAELIATIRPASPAAPDGG